MRIYSASIVLSLLLLLPCVVHAQKTVFSQARCTIVYSLKGSEYKYFNDEINQLGAQINRKNIRFIDLNNWRRTPPHIDLSGRRRHQLRRQYALVEDTNQAIVVDKQGKVLSRYSGSVSLVNTLMDCD